MIFLKGRRRFFVLVRRQFVPYLINLPTSISVLYFIHLTQLDEAIKIFNVVFFLCFFLAGYFWHITDLHFDSTYSTKGDISRSK